MGLLRKKPKNHVVPPQTTPPEEETEDAGERAPKTPPAESAPVELVRAVPTVVEPAPGVIQNVTPETHPHLFDDFGNKR
jgi:hypothetical protein